MTVSLAWPDSWVTWMVLPRLSLVTMSGCFSTSCSRYAWHLQRTSYHVLQPSHPPPLTWSRSMDNLIKMMNYKYWNIFSYRVQTGIVHHQCRRRKRMTGRSCWCGPGTCSSRRRWSESSAWSGSNITALSVNNIVPPFRPRWGSDYWSGADCKQVPGLAEVDNIEYYSLVNMNVLNWEVKPKPIIKMMK